MGLLMGLKRFKRALMNGFGSTHRPNVLRGCVQDICAAHHVVGRIDSRVLVMMVVMIVLVG